MKVFAAVIAWTCVGCAGLLVTGCWDQVELSQRAIVIGSAMDLADDGGIIVTEQISIPEGPRSSPGSTGKNFFVISARGRNWMEAFSRLQMKLSRRIYLSHRRTVYVGEALARRGIAPYLDELVRNPDSRLRTDVMIVRRTPAAEVMGIATPLERMPSVAAEGIREMNGETPGRSLLDCLIAAASSTNAPVLPAVVIRHASITRAKDVLDSIQLSGVAVLNRRLQMIGSLTNQEESVRLWICNAVEQQLLTVEVSGGTASVRLTGLHARLMPVCRSDGELVMHVVLVAKAAVVENDSDLDFKSVADVHRLERALGAKIERVTARSIVRVQREYGSDVYGFDDAFMRSFPSRWPQLSRRWSTRFAHMRLGITCRVAVLSTGTNGAPLGIGESARRTLEQHS